MCNCSCQPRSARRRCEGREEPCWVGAGSRASQFFAAFAVCCFVVACGGAAKSQPGPKLNRFGKPYKEGVVAPEWVQKIPEAKQGKLLAVGYSPPTYWPQDAINAAGQDARGKLALALTSHVEVLGIDTASQAGQQTAATIDKEATDVVMQNSRIEATWVDENGDRSEPGGVFALASIEMDSVRAGHSSSEAQPAVATPGKPGAPAAKPAAPAWLDHLPGSSGKVYAAGYSGPTYVPENALQYAGDNAIDNLCASLRAHVQAYTLLVENASGLTVDQFSQAEDPDEAFKDIVRKNAKVEATWVDKDGARPGDPPGAVWALASIDVQSTKGGVQSIQNQDLGPALDKQGNVEPPK